MSLEINIVGSFIEMIGTDLNNLCETVSPENVTVDQIYSSPSIVNTEYWHDQMLQELNGKEMRTVLETVGSTKYHGSNIPGNSFVCAMMMELQDTDPKIWNVLINSTYLAGLYSETVKE